MAVECWPGSAGELREWRVDVGEIIWDFGESPDDHLVILSGLNVKFNDIRIVINKFNLSRRSNLL